jgi:hypothetical protein
LTDADKAKPAELILYNTIPIDSACIPILPKALENFS